MIPGQGTPQTSSPFPNPPEYAMQYTNERIVNGSVLEPPPCFTEFRVFGEEYRLNDEVIAPLGMSGIRELYSNKKDWKTEMKKLNRSALAAFLDIVEILIRCPDNPARDEKMNDLHTIFINMHHLINEYRPVQARDTIRLLQSQQLEQLKETVEDYKGYLGDAREVLAEQFEKTRKVKLGPIPLPKPITGIQLKEKGVIENLGEFEEEKVDIKKKSRAPVRVKLIDASLQRREPQVSREYLLARQEFERICLNPP